MTWSIYPLKLSIHAYVMKNLWIETHPYADTKSYGGVGRMIHRHFSFPQDIRFEEPAWIKGFKLLMKYPSYVD